MPRLFEELLSSISLDKLHFCYLPRVKVLLPSSFFLDQSIVSVTYLGSKCRSPAVLSRTRVNICDMPVGILSLRRGDSVFLILLIWLPDVRIRQRWLPSSTNIYIDIGIYLQCYELSLRTYMGSRASCVAVYCLIPFWVLLFCWYNIFG